MRHVRAPRARRRRAWGPSGVPSGVPSGGLLGWVRRAGRYRLGGGCPKLCLERGFFGLGRKRLGEEAAWWALGHGGLHNGGGRALETCGVGVRGIALLVWFGVLGDISP